MNRELRRIALGGLLAAIGTLALLSAPSAEAVVTVGSPLTAPFTPVGDNGSGSGMYTNVSLPEPGAQVTSPVSGVIVRWRITNFIGGPFHLRVLTPGGGLTYTAAGTSAPETPSSTATQTFATNLPISAGEAIGVDTPASPHSIGGAIVLGAAESYFFPPLADNETRAGGGPVNGAEIGFNADVATVPSNKFSFGKVERNKQRGTARLTVEVPGPGRLSLSGQGVKSQRRGGAAASKVVAAAGPVQLKVKANGLGMFKLNRSGKFNVRVKVTYTPSGDLPGVPKTKSKPITLVKNG